MILDTDLEENLLFNNYTLAYDVLSKRWVFLLGSFLKEDGSIDIRAARYSDGIPQHYKPHELVRYK